MKRLYYLLLVLLLSGFSIQAQINQSKEEIKNHFKNGYAPLEIHFGYLIDACYNYSIGEGILYNPANNVLKAEVPLRILEQHLTDTARTLRDEYNGDFGFINQQLLMVKDSLMILDLKLLNRINEVEQAIRSDYQNSLLDLDQELNQEIDLTNKKIIQQEIRILNTLQDSIKILKEDIFQLDSDHNRIIKNLESDLENQIAQLSSKKSLELRDTANNIRLSLNTGFKNLELALADSCINIRTSLKEKTQELKTNIDQNNYNITTQLLNLSTEKTSEIADTARAVRSDLNSLINFTNNKLSSEIIRIDGVFVDVNNNLTKTAFDIRNEVDFKINQVEINLQDTARNLRDRINSLDKDIEDKYSFEVTRLDTKINKTQLALQDTSLKVRSDFNIKLEQLEETLQDTAKVIRKSLNDFNESLKLKIESGDLNLESLLSQTKINLIKKIDSLAEIHNVDRKKHEDRMTLIEEKHSILSDTVFKMKVKLDTLNYTEENFTQTLKLKLDNVEDGATRSDNNFTDELKSKLDGIENNANNYQLPLGTHSKLGGIQLSQDFVLYNGKAYNALDANKIDREYAKDTITKNWSKEMKDEDEWTRIRYKIENGLVDVEGNKLYDYGEWNQAYKFIYDDLESSYYEFNATDSINVILGIHEKDKKFTGTDNTLLGHNAGFTLYKGGNRNIAIGKDAGRASENISDNVFIGNQAGESIGDPLKTAEVTGEYSSERNVAVGNKAMKGRNSSGKSIAVGFSAFELGEQNSSIAIGYKAAETNSGTNNVFIGYEAGLSTPGSKNSNNIAIGYRSGFKNTYTKRNVFIGDSTAFNNESGENNIFIGHGAGKTNTGNRNLIIGNDINIAGDDQLAIGNKGSVLISGDFITKSVSIDKLSTKELNVTTSKSDSYFVADKKVIDNTASFVGEGGVNTSGQIKSSFTNSKASINKAISAPNGSLFGKYVAASDALLIGNSEVITSTEIFVGKGGVNTLGSISTGSDLNAEELSVKKSNISESLIVAGLSLVEVSGGTTQERYAIKLHQHQTSDINTNANNRFVSDLDIANWNNKVDKVTGKQLSSNDFSNTYKSKLDGLEVGANKYVHPSSHTANIIIEDASHRFVSDTEKSNWNNKVDKVFGKQLSSNNYTDVEKTKLALIESGANKYVHPSNHSASIISQDATHRFVSDSEKSNWNNKVDKVSGKQLSTKDFTSSYKSKLDGIATGANKYVHPVNHSASTITQDAAHRFVSDTDKNSWNNKVDKASGKQLSTNDFTASYKSKLDGIATGANKYVHPAKHSASTITLDATHRFVSDTEKASWNNKADKSALSSNDYTNAEKSKLAGIQAGANKYTHPANHSANMISTTTNKQFVSQTEKESWTAGQVPLGGIIMWNGTSVPNGWALCNGQTVNGKATPDLRGRFIVGSYPGKSGFNTGNSGGTVTNAGETSTAGSHTHTGNTGGCKLTSSDLPSHSHGMSHTHKIPAKKGVKYSSTSDDSNPGGSGKGSRRTMDETRDYNFSTEAASTSYTGYTGKSNSSINAHKHTISADGSHTHSAPYYVLAFIMRVK